MTAHVTVLGASGFIGNAVLRELTRHPVRLRAVARSAPPELPPDAGDVEQLRADLLEPGRAAQAATDTDVIVHLVAYAASGSTWRSAASAPAAERVNVGLVRELVAALQQRPAPPPVLLYASSVQAANPSGASRYAQQKIEAEEIIQQATEDGYVRGVILRLPVVYGRYGRSGPTGRGVVATMARRALAGEQLAMWHQGSVRRHLLHVRDAASAFAAALEHHGRLVGGAWTLSADRARPLSEIFSVIAASVAQQTGAPPVPVVGVPAPTDAEANDFRSDDFDSTDFRAQTGWRPRVPLREGIDRTVAALIRAEE